MMHIYSDCGDISVDKLSRADILGIQYVTSVLLTTYIKQIYNLWIFDFDIREQTLSWFFLD